MNFLPSGLYKNRLDDYSQRFCKKRFSLVNRVTDHPSSSTAVLILALKSYFPETHHYWENWNYWSPYLNIWLDWTTRRLRSHTNETGCGSAEELSPRVLEGSDHWQEAGLCGPPRGWRGQGVLDPPPPVTAAFRPTAAFTQTIQLLSSDLHSLTLNMNLIRTFPC